MVTQPGAVTSAAYQVCLPQVRAFAGSSTSNFAQTRGASLTIILGKSNFEFAVEPPSWMPTGLKSLLYTVGLLPKLSREIPSRVTRAFCTTIATNSASCLYNVMGHKYYGSYCILLYRFRLQILPRQTTHT